jgi:hypothetical protein
MKLEATNKEGLLEARSLRLEAAAEGSMEAGRLKL